MEAQHCRSTRPDLAADVFDVLPVVGKRAHLHSASTKGAIQVSRLSVFSPSARDYTYLRIIRSPRLRWKRKRIHWADWRPLRWCVYALYVLCCLHCVLPSLLNTHIADGRLLLCRRRGCRRRQAYLPMHARLQSLWHRRGRLVRLRYVLLRKRRMHCCRPRVSCSCMRICYWRVWMRGDDQRRPRRVVRNLLGLRHMAIRGRRVYLVPPCVCLRRWLVLGIERLWCVMIGISVRMYRRVRRRVVHLVVVLLLSPRLLMEGYGTRRLLMAAGAVRHLVHDRGWRAQEPRRLLLSSAGDATPELL